MAVIAAAYAPAPTRHLSHAGGTDVCIRSAGHLHMNIPGDAELKDLSELRDPRELRNVRDAPPGLLPQNNEVGRVVPKVARSWSESHCKDGSGVTAPRRDRLGERRKFGKRRRNSSASEAVRELAHRRLPVEVCCTRGWTDPL